MPTPKRWHPISRDLNDPLLTELKSIGHWLANVRQHPPKKQPGQGVGPRTINGAIIDVHRAAAFLGTSEKTIRNMVERKVVPFRWLGSRLVFVRSELELFLIGLPGCPLDEARTNAAARRGK